MALVLGLCVIAMSFVVLRSGLNTSGWLLGTATAGALGYGEATREPDKTSTVTAIGGIALVVAYVVPAFAEAFLQCAILSIGGASIGGLVFSARSRRVS